MTSVHLSLSPSKPGLSCKAKVAFPPVPDGSQERSMREQAGDSIRDVTLALVEAISPFAKSINQSVSGNSFETAKLPSPKPGDGWAQVCEKARRERELQVLESRLLQVPQSAQSLAPSLALNRNRTDKTFQQAQFGSRDSSTPKES